MKAKLASGFSIQQQGAARRLSFSLNWRFPSQKISYQERATTNYTEVSFNKTVKCSFFEKISTNLNKSRHFPREKKKKRARGPLIYIFSHYIIQYFYKKVNKFAKNRAFSSKSSKILLIYNNYNIIFYKSQTFKLSPGARPQPFSEITQQITSKSNHSTPATNTYSPHSRRLVNFAVS